MSYDNHHYCPGESGWREERPSRSSQLIDSYVPDSYSSNHRNTRPLPPSPHARDRDPTPPPRRLPSPNDSYGDRDGSQRSHRETPVAASSTQDRVRFAHDNVPHERTRERRLHLLHRLSAVIYHETQKGHQLQVHCPPPPLPPPLVLGAFAPPEVEDKGPRRRLAKPWESSCAIRYLVPFCSTSSHGHTDAHHGILSSPLLPFIFSLYSPLHASLHLYSLGPRSPASYPCDSQESVNTTPQSSIKASQSVSDDPSAGRKSRFSQADAPTQHSNRHSDSREVGMWRARPDDVPRSARYIDDIPSPRCRSSTLSTVVNTSFPTFQIVANIVQGFHRDPCPSVPSIRPSAIHGFRIRFQVPSGPGLSSGSVRESF
ncbi:hypothetical protein EV363DRAFT_1485075 [Boletus edulis]|nr:hypothetical protein EV363DRAFT_1485075 [Boletus edulis]